MTSVDEEIKDEVVKFITQKLHTLKVDQKDDENKISDYEQIRKSISERSQKILAYEAILRSYDG